MRTRATIVLTVVVLAAGAASACGASGAGPADFFRGQGVKAPQPVAEIPPVEAPALPLRGCPPPARPPGGAPPSPPFVPPVLVPESELPAPLPARTGNGDLRALDGKGMWLWKYFQSEGGNPDAIVARAKAAGVRQLWVRVGDSADNF